MSDLKFPSMVEIKEKLLSYVGFVPQMVIYSCMRLREDEREIGLADCEANEIVNKVTSELKTFIKSIIRTDQQHFIGRSQIAIYSKVLAILGTGGTVHLNEYEMSPVDIPWTLLKATRGYRCMAVGPVSPMVQEIVKEHILSDEAAYERNVSMDFYYL